MRLVPKAALDQRHQHQADQHRAHTSGDVPDEFLPEGVSLLLSVEVGDDGVLPAKALILDAGGHKDHHADGEQGQKDHPGLQVLQSGPLGKSGQAQSGEDSSGGKGDPPGEAVHKGVVLRRVAGAALLYAAPEKDVKIHAIQIADAQEGIHLGKAQPRFP